MKILEFKASDQKETEEFMKSIYQEMGWMEYWEEKFSNLYQYFDLSVGTSFIIAKENEKVIATTVLERLNNNVGIVKKFYVHQDYRGIGLAQNMFKAIVEKAEKSDFQKIVLDVLKTNLRAVKFYEKNSFKKYDQEPIKSWPESQRPDIFHYYFLEI